MPNELSLTTEVVANLFTLDESTAWSLLHRIESPKRDWPYFDFPRGDEADRWQALLRALQTQYTADYDAELTNEECDRLDTVFAEDMYYETGYYDNGPYAEVRKGALKLVAQHIGLHDPDVRLLVLKALTQDGHEFIRETAAAALGNCPQCPDLAVELANILGKESGAVSRILAHSLICLASSMEGTQVAELSATLLRAVKQRVYPDDALSVLASLAKKELVAKHSLNRIAENSEFEFSKEAQEKAKQILVSSNFRNSSQV